MKLLPRKQNFQKSHCYDLIASKLTQLKSDKFNFTTQIFGVPNGDSEKNCKNTEVSEDESTRNSY